MKAVKQIDPSTPPLEEASPVPVKLFGTAFTWRGMVSSADGPESPTTRHVLLALSLFMSEKGESCFPSQEKLAASTGLTRQCVIKHLQLAETEGWITRQVKGKNGQGWALHQYSAVVPSRLRKAVNQDDHVGERQSTSLTKVVNEDDTNSPITIQKLKLTNRDGQIELIAEFANRVGLPDHAESFIDYYTSNGWLVSGKSKMKDWESSYRGWCRREEKWGAARNGGRRQSQDHKPKSSKLLGENYDILFNK